MSRGNFKAIWSWVSVPVLSVQRVAMAPKHWIELMFLTMTCCLDMAMAPLARLAVTIIGSISGVRPTATERAKKKASPQLPFSNPLMRNTLGAITSMKRSNSPLTSFTPLSNPVLDLGTSIPSAMEPRIVRPPV